MKRFPMPHSPCWLAEQNRVALRESDNRSAWLKEVRRAGYGCERCSFVGWKRQLMDQLQIRRKEPFGGKPVKGYWVLCPSCTTKHDKKLRKAS